MESNEIVATYCSAWNEPDAARRTALLEVAWADDGVYHDPTGTAEGRAGLVAHIAGFHETFPGHTIEPASGVDDNGNALRFAWVMRNGEEVALEGIDYCELAPDGRIRRIEGFFGPFPPLEG